MRLCRPVRRRTSPHLPGVPLLRRRPKIIRITAREIVRIRTSVHRAPTSYRDDMPKPELFSAMLSLWRKRYIVMPADKRPSSPAQAIKESDEDMCASQNCMHASMQ